MSTLLCWSHLLLHSLLKIVHNWIFKGYYSALPFNLTKTYFWHRFGMRSAEWFGRFWVGFESKTISKVCFQRFGGKVPQNILLTSDPFVPTYLTNHKSIYIYNSISNPIYCACEKRLICSILIIYSYLIHMLRGLREAVLND